MTFVQQVTERYHVHGTARGSSGAHAVVPVANLVLGRAFREGGASEPRVQELMANPAGWGPVRVARCDGTVIDGRHRVLAARRLGRASIEVSYFDGGTGDAFVEFLGCNGRDGLALTMRDRNKAVRRVLHLHPEWADRRIGELCGISSKTVGQIRSRVAEAFPSAGLGEVATRIGRDGRIRPVNPTAQRERVAEALRSMPGASLRKVAGAVGASPETVRSVRASLRNDDQLPVNPGVEVLLEAMLARGTRPAWRADAAVRTGDGGEAAATFLERTDVSGTDAAQCAAAIPLSRIYEVADEARRRAQFWLQLAERVEGRARRDGR